MIEVHNEKVQPRRRISCGDCINAAESFLFPQFPHSHTHFHCKQCFAKILMAKTVSSDIAGGIERRMLKLLHSYDKLL